MISVKNDLQLREDELQNYINYIEYFENPNCFNSGFGNTVLNPMQLKTSMKASTIIMLYNVVESTVTSCLKKIHSSINQQGLKYDQLSQYIKQIILVYYENLIKECDDIKNKVQYRIEQIDLLKGRLTFNKSYEEISKQYSMYSGNLDSKKYTVFLVNMELILITSLKN